MEIDCSLLHVPQFFKYFCILLTFYFSFIKVFVWFYFCSLFFLKFSLLIGLSFLLGPFGFLASGSLELEFAVWNLIIFAVRLLRAVPTAVIRKEISPRPYLLALKPEN